MSSIREEWDALCATRKKYADKRNQASYNEYRRGILTKMVSESILLSKFGIVDEELYSHCKRLMLSYKETVGLYERFREDISNEDVRKIIDGIITILVSRLREFEETAADDLQNPITIEKQTIINQMKTNLEEAIIAGWQRDSKRDLYRHYCEHMLKGQILLNDLERRKTTHQYLTLMELEHEILSTIIRVQIAALEQAAEDTAEDTDPLEKLSVHKILTLLREGYQYFGRAFEEVREVFYPPEDARIPQWKPEPFETFQLFLEQTESRIDMEQGEYDYEAQLKIFRAKIAQDAELFLSRYKIDFFKAVYRFRKMVNDETMLAEEMARAFVSMRKRWPSGVDEILDNSTCPSGRRGDVEQSTFGDFEIDENSENSACPSDRREIFEELEELEKVEEVENLGKVDDSEEFEDLETLENSENLEKVEPVEKVEKVEEVEKVEKVAQEELSQEVKEGLQILHGVAETIEIKIEGLRESSAQMIESSTKLVDNFTERFAPTQAPLELSESEIWAFWLDNPDTFYETLNNLPAFVERLQTQERQIAKCSDDLEKNLAKFKRETLLYEISTYEEIIFYSISRLRGLPQFATAVAVADETLQNIETLLKKSNIDIIRPMPHDMFNPKEHEVLMAESNADFKKGEIVKVMNSGYRRKDLILLRANVIAAR